MAESCGLLRSCVACSALCWCSSFVSPFRQGVGLGVGGFRRCQDLMLTVVADVEEVGTAKGKALTPASAAMLLKKSSKVLGLSPDLSSLMGESTCRALENWYASLGSDRESLRVVALGSSMQVVSKLASLLGQLLTSGTLNLQSTSPSVWAKVSEFDLGGLDIDEAISVAQTCGEGDLVQRLEVVKLTTRLLGHLACVKSFLVASSSRDGRRITKVMAARVSSMRQDCNLFSSLMGGWRLHELFHEGDVLGAAMQPDFPPTLLTTAVSAHREVTAGWVQDLTELQAPVGAPFVWGLLLSCDLSYRDFVSTAPGSRQALVSSWIPCAWTMKKDTLLAAENTEVE